MALSPLTPTLGPNRIYWYCLIGLTAWAVLHQRDVPGVPLGPFLAVLALAALNLLLRIGTSGRRERRPDRIAVPLRLSWVFVACNLLLVAAGLRLTGGLQSPIWSVMFVVVAGETVLESKREATITRLGVCLAMVLGTAPWPLSRADWPAYTLEMFVRLGFLLAVSSVTRRLRERSDATKAELSSLRAELALAEERARLSREVHDGVGNSLAASVLRLELAARLREKAVPGDETVAMLKEEAQALREAMTTVRDWTFLHRPWPAPEGPDGTAGAVLTREVERLSQRTGLPMTVVGAELLDRQPLSDAARLTVLRIAQESLTNAAKHARSATGAQVCLRDDGGLVLEVSDDGAGFDAGQGGTGVGLSSMRERAAGLRGTLQVASQPGHGTRITLRLPWVGTRLD
jgi:signal transduction histidine kinase